MRNNGIVAKCAVKVVEGLFFFSHTTKKRKFGKRQLAIVQSTTSSKVYQRTIFRQLSRTMKVNFFLFTLFYYSLVHLFPFARHDVIFVDSILILFPISRNPSNQKLFFVLIFGHFWPLFIASSKFKYTNCLRHQQEITTNSSYNR